jgi:DME family drug/metabolite transporter
MRTIFTGENAIAPPVGIEPTTYGLEVRRSIHLSYGSNLLAQIYRPLNYRLAVRSRLLVLFAAICFATTGTSRALGPDSATSLGVAAIRFIVGALALFVITAFARRPLITTVSLPLYIWIIAGFGQAMYGATFFAAVHETGVAVGTVVALGSAPILTGVLSALLFRSLPSRKWMLATAIAIAGMSLIVTSGKDRNISAIGIVYALGAGLGYALFALASKRIVESGVASDKAMARVFGIAAVMLFPTLLFVNTDWIFTTGGVSLGLWLGVVTVALAYWAYASGLRNLEPRETTMITLAEPVVATILGAAVLDERPAALAWFGIIMVIAALGYESRSSVPQS